MLAWLYFSLYLVEIFHILWKNCLATVLLFSENIGEVLFNVKHPTLTPNNEVLTAVDITSLIRPEIEQENQMTGSQ